MQIIPVIPQTQGEVEDRLNVKGIAAVKPAKRVEERTLPPLVSHTREQLPKETVEIFRREKREKLQQIDRRMFCRRVRHQTLLEELRSSIDRRRKKGRKLDLQVHIDEEV